MAGNERALGMPELRRLHELVGRLNGCRTVAQTLALVVDGVVDVVGFDVAAVSYVHGNGTFETVAVAGNYDARAMLLGSRKPGDAYDAEFAVAEHWGALRFVPHDRLPPGTAPGWVPDVEASDDPDAWHPLDALYAPLCSADGELVGVLSVDLPRDRRRPGALQRELLEMFATQAGIAVANARLTERLRASEEAFRIAFEGAGTGLALISMSPAHPGRYLRVNPALCELVGYSTEELLTRDFTDITHPDDVERDVDAMHRARAGSPDVYQAEKRDVRADGTSVWVAVTTSVVLEDDGTPVYAISQVEDISARRADREELMHRANHDVLTGLPNRHLVIAQLKQLAQSTSIIGRDGPLLFCDVDGFKEVNDRYGHVVGDLVLSTVARRLQETSRRHDTVGRYGGDEFVVIANDVSRREAEELAGRLRHAVARPIALADRATTVDVSISIGVATIDGGGGADEVLRDADDAMYRAKLAARELVKLRTQK